jgi:uncharacterized membrane protein YcaP (DUF421 family)
MFELLSEFAKELPGLGLEAAELEMRHMGWRAFVVFCFVFHQVLGTLAYRFHRVSQLIKGRTQLLVKDGKVQESEMRRCKITPDDLNEHLRLNGRVLGPGDVAEARLERNGSISVVRRRTPGGED